MQTKFNWIAKIPSYIRLICALMEGPQGHLATCVTIFGLFRFEALSILISVGTTISSFQLRIVIVKFCPSYNGAIESGKELDLTTR